MSSYYEKMLATGEVKCIDEEVPFEIPQSWGWERWGNIAQTIQYGYNAPALEHGVIKMVRISDIQENCVLWDNVPYCLIDENDIDTYLLKVNDILFARTGGTVGKSFLVEEVPEKAIYAGYLIRTRYSSLLNPRYMKSFMESQLYWEQLKNGTIATAQPNCNGKTLAKMLLPIPPTKEQDRIVKKLTQLSSFLDNYGLCQDRLNLLNEEIKEHLKKSILQEAIQGKLVPQLAEEGTAQELLEQIKTEKLNLVKEGKLKKSALATSVIFRGDDNKYWEKKVTTCECIDEDIPFDVPESWAWVRLETILNTGSARRVHAKDWRQAGIPFYRAREIGKLADDGFVDNELYIDLSLYEDFSSSGVPLPNDLMITAVGTLGKVYIVKESDKFYYKDGSVLCLANKYGLCAEYLKMVIESPFFKGQYRQESQGTTVATLTMVRLQKYFIPIPPLQEQYRIVETYRNIASIMS